LDTEDLFILHQEYVDDDHDDDDDDVMIRKTMKTFSLSQALCTATGILLELHLPRFHTNVDAYLHNYEFSSKPRGICSADDIVKCLNSIGITAQGYCCVCRSTLYCLP